MEIVWMRRKSEKKGREQGREGETERERERREERGMFSTEEKKWQAWWDLNSIRQVHPDIHWSIESIFKYLSNKRQNMRRRTTKGEENTTKISFVMKMSTPNVIRRPNRIDIKMKSWSFGRDKQDIIFPAEAKWWYEGSCWSQTFEKRRRRKEVDVSKDFNRIVPISMQGEDFDILMLMHLNVFDGMQNFTIELSRWIHSTIVDKDGVCVCERRKNRARTRGKN